MLGTSIELQKDLTPALVAKPRQQLATGASLWWASPQQTPSGGAATASDRDPLVRAGPATTASSAVAALRLPEFGCARFCMLTHAAKCCRGSAAEISGADRDFEDAVNTSIDVPCASYNRFVILKWGIVTSMNGSPATA